MQVGTSILHYEILDKLGEGGMGIVYKARDTKLDRTVALKFLPPHLTKSQEDRKRFIREAKSAAALNHPNICTIHSVEKHDGKDFISMEHIDGQTLREKLESGKITFESALDYAVQITDALSEAHQKGIIHRDIKPGNIMVDSKNQIKVMDFGLAKMADSAPITKTGATVGTMAYMAPEQIEGKQINYRADLFSFGVVLFEMLTGERPFKGQYDAALTYAIANEDPPLVTDLKPELPEELSRLVNRLLEKEPEARLGSAAEVRNLLESIKDSTGEHLKQIQRTDTGDESTNQDRDSGSTTISITMPNGSFGSRAGLLVGVLALVLLAGWWFVGGNAPDNPEETSGGEVTDRSIAVLPFEALGQVEPDVFTEGMHDDLLARLSNVSGLKVISRTSVQQYLNTQLTTPEIAGELGVQWVLEGGVQEMGNQIQVNAQLIDPGSDTHIWADSYRRELTAANLFDIQSEITKSIVTSLEAELSPEEAERVERQPTEDLDAYRLYVRGRTQLNTRTTEGMQQAVEYFQRAIEQDSSYALAWSGLADVIGLQGSPYDSLEVTLPDHEQTARRALELDPDLAETHASMGLFHFDQQNGPAALRELQRAVELKPSYAQAHHWLGFLQLQIGRLDAAHEHLSLAVELNPQHVAARGVLVQALVALGDLESAERQVQQLRGLPDWMRRDHESYVMYHRKRWDELESLALEEVQESAGSSSQWRFYLARIAVLRDDTAAARDHLAELREEEGASVYKGLVHAALGESGPAYSVWENFQASASPQLVAIRYWYSDVLDPLREDPQYQELIQGINQKWGLNPDGSLPEETKTK